MMGLSRALAAAAFGLLLPTDGGCKPPARASVILLHRAHRVAALLQCGDAQGGGACAGERGHDRRAGVDGRGSNLDFVGARGLAGGRVDDELDFLVLEQVNRVGPTLGELVRRKFLKMKMS